MAILKDKSKKKKGENIIGKIIYGFLLFMPLIAVGVACLYTIINKNAYQSYSSKQVESTILVDSQQLQIENMNYIINLVTNSSSYSQNIYINSSSIDYNYLTGQQITYTVQGIRFYPNNTHIRLIDTANNVYNYELTNETREYLNGQQINYKNGDIAYTNNMPVKFYMITYQESKLDYVFYYQMEQLEESDLFNWTKNTGAYTVMHNVTSGIGISNTYTPMLMTYWLLISVIYFIFDIALILVWAVHDKIHELKDAI